MFCYLPKVRKKNTKRLNLRISCGLIKDTDGLFWYSGVANREEDQSEPKNGTNQDNMC